MKRFLSVLAVLAMVLAVFTGCSKSEADVSTSAVKEDEPITIGMIAQIFGTQSFNDDIKLGVDKAVEKYGIKAICLEVPDLTDSENSMRTLISQGVKFIIVGTGDQDDAMKSVASDYPDVTFLYLGDAIEGYDNVIAPPYAEHEGAFVLGALAGLLTNTGNVGTVAAVQGDIPQERFTWGFAAGARYVNPDITVQRGYTNSYSDINKGTEIAKVMYSKGADIVATFAGACNMGVFNAAKETPEGVYAFGAARGQFDMMPEKIVASLCKPVDQAVEQIIGQYVEGTLDTSKEIKFGLETNGVVVRYTDMNDDLRALITPEIEAQLEQIKADIISGKIVPPQNESEYNAFKF